MTRVKSYAFCLSMVLCDSISLLAVFNLGDECCELGLCRKSTVYVFLVAITVCSLLALEGSRR